MGVGRPVLKPVALVELAEEAEGATEGLALPTCITKGFQLGCTSSGQLARPNAWSHAGRRRKSRVWRNITKPVVFIKQTRDALAAWISLDIAYSGLGTLCPGIRGI